MRWRLSFKSSVLTEFICRPTQWDEGKSQYCQTYLVAELFSAPCVCPFSTCTWKSLWCLLCVYVVGTSSWFKGFRWLNSAQWWPKGRKLLNSDVLQLDLPKQVKIIAKVLLHHFFWGPLSLRGLLWFGVSELNINKNIWPLSGTKSV